MRKIILCSLIVICAISIIHAFFMPWAKASTSTTRVARSLVDQARGPLENAPFAGKFLKIFDTTTKKVTDLGDVRIRAVVSGYDIPTLINKRTSKTAVSIASVIFKDAGNLDKKSMLVYLVPLLALACIGLAILSIKNKIALIVMALLSGAIAIGGLYNLMTVKFSDLIVQISIEQGLWQTLYAYLLICAISVIWIIWDLWPVKK